MTLRIDLLQALNADLIEFAKAAASSPNYLDDNNPLFDIVSQANKLQHIVKNLIDLQDPALEGSLAVTRLADTYGQPKENLIAYLSERMEKAAKAFVETSSNNQYIKSQDAILPLLERMLPSLHTIVYGDQGRKLAREPAAPPAVELPKPPPTKGPGFIEQLLTGQRYKIIKAGDPPEFRDDEYEANALGLMSIKNPKEIFDEFTRIFNQQTDDAGRKRVLKNAEKLLVQLLKADPLQHYFPPLYLKSEQGEIKAAYKQFMNAVKAQHMDTKEFKAHIKAEQKQLRKANKSTAKLMKAAESADQNQTDINQFLQALKGPVTAERMQDVAQMMAGDMRQYFLAKFMQIEAPDVYRFVMDDAFKTHTQEIGDYTKFVNETSAMVRHDILTAKPMEYQKRVAEFYAIALNMAIKNKDYTTAMAISSGLNETPVHRLLMQYRNEIPSVDEALALAEPDGVLSALDNYANLTEQITKDLEANDITIPYVGKYQSSSEFVHQGQKEFIENKEIMNNKFANFGLLKLIQGRVGPFQDIQEKSLATMQQQGQVFRPMMTNITERVNQANERVRTDLSIDENLTGKELATALERENVALSYKLMPREDIVLADITTPAQLYDLYDGAFGELFCRKITGAADQNEGLVLLLQKMNTFAKDPNLTQTDRSNLYIMLADLNRIAENQQEHHSNKKINKQIKNLVQSLGVGSQTPTADPFADMPPLARLPETRTTSPTQPLSIEDELEYLQQYKAIYVKDSYEATEKKLLNEIARYNVLISNSNDPEFKSMLEDARDKLVQHLQTIAILYLAEEDLQKRQASEVENEAFLDLMRDAEEEAKRQHPGDTGAGIEPQSQQETIQIDQAGKEALKAFKESLKSYGANRHSGGGLLSHFGHHINQSKPGLEELRKLDFALDKYQEQPTAEKFQQLSEAVLRLQKKEIAITKSNSKVMLALHNVTVALGLDPEQKRQTLTVKV